MTEPQTLFTPLPFVSSRDRETATQWHENHPRKTIGSDKDQVVSYLRSAYCAVAVPGIERNPTTKAAIGDAPPNIMTDGSRIWVQRLAYWVQEHDYALPVQFLQHVRDRRGVPPDQASVPLEKLGAAWESRSCFWPTAEG